MPQVTQLHPRICIDSISFPGAGVPELCGHWRRLGARHVGLIDFQIGDRPATLRATLDAAGLELETIVHPFMAGKALVNDPAAWEAPRAALNRVIDAAALLNARSIYMLTGGHGSLSWEEAAEVFCQTVAPCADRARAAGIVLAIENATALHADIHIAHTVRDAVTLAERADIGICIDLFAGWTEAGLQQSVERAVPRLCLVQVDDYVYGDRSLPARAVPGDGAIPIKRILGWILRAGYQGKFDLELIGPRIDREGHVVAVERAARNLGAILTELGA
jgi:sugar phosphate isomerase/epimerase